jgi:molybdopterin synthase catalytic subunit
MTVRVKLFAILREKAKCGEVTLELPAGASAAVAAEMISRRFPAISALVPRVALAVNREYAPSDKVLFDGDELALLPAVSGGSDER